MARQASGAGVSVAGKTGTAEGTESTQSHGWFAGWAPAKNPQVALVVYLPAGHGADAARVAADVLANSPMGKQ
jgi:peptidoglycan glycosyltransferase